MPNSGNGDPTDPLRAVGGRGAGPLSHAEASAGPGATAPAEGSTAASGAAAAESVAGSPNTDAIAAALASGAIDPAAAQAQLIEQAVRAQLPHDATPATVAAIRAEVEALLGGNPLLERLLRP
jgi:hypothetical protein